MLLPRVRPENFGDEQASPGSGEFRTCETLAPDVYFTDADSVSTATTSATGTAIVPVPVPREFTVNAHAFVKRLLYPVLLDEAPTLATMRGVDALLIDAQRAAGAKTTHLATTLPLNSQLTIVAPEDWLVIGHLRRARRDLTIGVQSHLPIPDVEQWARLGDGGTVLRSLAEAHLVGVHVGSSAPNLQEALFTATGVQSVPPRIRAYPIATDAEYFGRLAVEEATAAEREELRRQLRLGNRKVTSVIAAREPNKGTHYAIAMWRELLVGGDITPDSDTLVTVLPERPGEKVPENIEYGRQLLKEIHKLNSEYPDAIQVIETGLSSRQLCALHQLTDVFAMPSHGEGNSFLAQEGPASGSEAVQLISTNSAYYAQYGEHCIGVELHKRGDEPAPVWPIDVAVTARAARVYAEGWRLADSWDLTRRQHAAAALRRLVIETPAWGPAYQHDLDACAVPLTPAKPQSRPRNFHNISARNSSSGPGSTLV